MSRDEQHMNTMTAMLADLNRISPTDVLGSISFPDQATLSLDNQEQLAGILEVAAQIPGETAAVKSLGENSSAWFVRTLLLNEEESCGCGAFHPELVFELNFPLSALEGLAELVARYATELPSAAMEDITVEDFLKATPEGAVED